MFTSNDGELAPIDHIMKRVLQLFTLLFCPSIAQIARLLDTGYCNGFITRSDCVVPAYISQ